MSLDTRRTEWVNTTTPLGIAATFSQDSSSIKDGVLHAKRVMGYAIADQASAANGLKIEQSSDGVNWDVSTLATLAANIATTVDVKLIAKHLRVRLINGGIGQTSLRLSLYLDSEYGGSI